MPKIRGPNTFFETQTFRQGSPPVLEPTTVALLPTPYADGAICPVTDDPENPVYVRKGGVWIPVSGTGGSNIITFEPLAFPIDYNDVSAIDPPAGTIFTRQAEIDSFLLSGGATAFKHIKACWESLPQFVLHAVIFNLAPGVHRPRNPEPDTGGGFHAFKLDGIEYIGGITLQGASPSQYRVTVVSAAITSSGAGDDPYVEFAGTPFTGLNLRGHYAVFDTGQATVIHKHTNNRLYLTNEPSPTPSTCFVGRPSTIIRNSYDDLVPTGTYGCLFTDGNSDWSSITLNDLTIDGFSCWWDFLMGSILINANNMLVDNAADIDDFSLSMSGVRPIQSWGAPTGAQFANVSVRGCGIANSPTSGTDTPLFWAGFRAYVSNSYFSGGWGIYVVILDSVLHLNRTVIDQMRTVGVQIDAQALISGQDLFYPGRINTIRNCGGPGLWWFANNINQFYYGFRMLFEGIAGPCIRLGDGVKIIDAGNNTTFINGSIPNADVGVEIVGVGNQLDIPANMTMNGTLGDVRMQDDEIWTYSNIKALGPIVDALGNIVRTV